MAGWLILSCSTLQRKGTEIARTITHRPTATSRTTTPESSLDGPWQVFYSWGCGTFSEAAWILNADGTFYSPEADGGGSWSLDGAAFHLRFDHSPFATYTGKANAARDYLEGTMTSDGGKAGCWNARKNIPTPPVTATAASTAVPNPAAVR